MNIEISQRSQKLIKKYLLVSGVNPRELPPIPSSVEFITLISWLNEEQIRPSKESKAKLQKNRPLSKLAAEREVRGDTERRTGVYTLVHEDSSTVSTKQFSSAVEFGKRSNEFILVSLRTELLQDLLVSMKGEDIRLPKEDKKNTKMDKIKFAVLTGAGILVAACQGFDSIVTMLSIFSLPSSIILGIGFAFSFLSVNVFCGFDLVKVSKALGVKLSDAYKLVDAYLLQLQMIKSLRKKIDNYFLSDLSLSDLKQLEHIISILKKHFSSLTEASKQFDQALNSENIQMVKILISGVSALLFFGGGFFTGQSVALFMSSLIVNSLIPFFGPVTIFSTVVGLAALCIFLFVERPALNKLVSSWFGLNEENVRKLCDNDLIIKEAKKLECLEEKVISMTRLSNRLTQLEIPVCVNDEMVYGSAPRKAAVGTKTNAPYYSFFKPPGILPAISIKEEHLEKTTYCFI